MQRETESQVPQNSPSSALEVNARQGKFENKVTASSTDTDSDLASEDLRKPREKDIKHWPPGHRPRLQHHPYDMWNNRPTARYGPGGLRPVPNLKGGSDAEPSFNEPSERADSEEPEMRLHFSWLDTDEAASGGSTVVYETESVVMTDEGSSGPDSESESEQCPIFVNVKTVRQLASCSPNTKVIAKIAPVTRSHYSLPGAKVPSLTLFPNVPLVL